MLPTLVGLLLLVGSWSAYVWQVRSIEDRARADTVTRAGEVSTSYQYDVAATIGLVQNVLRFMGTYAAANGIGQAAILVKNNHITNGTMGTISIVDSGGNGIAIDPHGAIRPAKIANQPEVGETLRTGRFVIGRPHTVAGSQDF